MRRTPPPKSSGTRNHCSISPAKVLKISAAANRIIRRQKGKNIRRAHPVSTVRPVLRPPHASVDYPAELRIDRLHELLVIVGGEPVLVEQQHTRQHAAKPLLHGSRLSGRVGSVGNRRNTPDYDDILFDTRGDAEAVLDAMNDIISQYGTVSVSDFYDLARVPNDNFTMNRYGWTNIGGATAVRVRDGYILKLPRAIPLN